MAVAFVGLILCLLRADLVHAEVQEDTADPDLSSLLQQPSLRGASQSQEQESTPSKCEPFLISLRRESVPVYRRGKIASFKTSYSGVLNVGTPAQEFRVVFDTGSGNLVLPAAECQSEACLVPDRRRFGMSLSSTAVPINRDGSAVLKGEDSDQVTIGFGTGEIIGELMQDQVCFGTPRSESLLEGTEASANEEKERCVEMSVVLAVEMSTHPFKTFKFDGILGLGLSRLALNERFSAFENILGSGIPASHFGVFLTEGEDGEESQIAMGGIDTRRILEPLSWAPVSMPEFGYWQVPIVAVRVNGQLLDVCEDGTCRGVVDTGTSHLGIPAPFDKEVSELLTREAGDTLDCRLIAGAEVEIELPGYNLTLHPANYMRRLPLLEGVSVGSSQGVYVPSEETPNNPSSQLVGQKGELHGDTEAPARRFCSPRLMPVRLPEPLGPKLFILGEPVLHRYYTVYDWANNQVGFGLANNSRNRMDPAEVSDRRGVLPQEVDMLLMQERVSMARSRGNRGAQQQEEVAFVQIHLRISSRSERC